MYAQLNFMSALNSKQVENIKFYILQNKAIQTLQQKKIITPPLFIKSFVNLIFSQDWNFTLRESQTLIE